MLNEYADIRSRIREEPLWYDHFGVPRFDKFHPSLCGVYCKEAVLLEIECQSCGQYFYVSVECSDLDFYRKGIQSLKPWIDEKKMSWGDPPRHTLGPFGDPCSAGDTMTAIVRRTVEFWSRENPKGQGLLEMNRDPNYEDVILCSEEEFGDY